MIGYGTDRGSEEIALAPLQVVDCPTQLVHDKYQRTGHWQGIPHICQFWGTTTLFRLVKGHQKVRDKIAKTGKKLSFLMLKGAPA